MTTPLSYAQHGRTYTYTRLGCRCEKCREVNRIACAERRAAYRSNPVLADMAGHGKRSTYSNHGCRCKECKAAHAAAHRAYNARKRAAK
ncbi:hypothetical protein [Streptomyces altiplanensis]